MSINSTIMSRSTNSTLTCPCGKVFSSPVYEYVNATRDPQLRYTVLAGLLNVATCPDCGRRVALSRPFIYSDADRDLLAYVHPRADAPEDARLLILEKLREVYTEIDARQEERDEQDSMNCSPGTVRESRDMPPLQVVFGLDQLNELINATLNQDERLGKLALNTHSRDHAERNQLLTIARKLAADMKCQIEVEDMPDEYTVWLYGSRKQIGALMRELAPGG